MRRKQKPNFMLWINTNSYTGNFERELIAYSFGILDSVQMDIDFCPEILDMFWQEEFGKTMEEFYKESEHELYEDYLFETYQEVDDWEQMTFYNIDRRDRNATGCNSAYVQLYKPLNDFWEEIILRRIKAFFEIRPYKYLTKDAKLLSIELVDKNNQVVKRWDCENIEN